MKKAIDWLASSIRPRIVGSFGVIAVLVIAALGLSYVQLFQMRQAARAIVPDSEQLSAFQDMASTLASLEADLEAFFVIGGVEFRDALLADLEGLKQVPIRAGEEDDEDVLASLNELLAGLGAEVTTLVGPEAAQLTSRQTNEAIVRIYGYLDEIEMLQQELAADELAQLQEAANSQERIVTRLSARFLVLGLVVVAVALFVSASAIRDMANPLVRLADVAGRVARGERGARAEVRTRDELGRLGLAFNQMTDQLQELIGGLERRVEERTRNLEAAARVSRVTSEILDVNVLLPRVVELVREQFGYYYVGIFLADETNQWAVLRAGTGEAGRRMLAQGWRLQIGGESMIGRAVATGQADIQLDVGEAAVRFNNPFLPETRSEVALPLRSRGRVIGALTIQSEREAAFEQADVATLENMADQVAAALENARLFQQVQESLEAERRAFGALSAQEWQKLLLEKGELGFVKEQGMVLPLAAGSAGASARMERSERADTTRTMPVRAAGQVVAMIEAQLPADSGGWTADQVSMLEALSAELGQALDRARLYRATEQSAARERLVTQVTGRIRESLELETMLRTAAEQIREALGLDKSVVRLAPAQMVGQGETMEQVKGE